MPTTIPGEDDERYAVSNAFGGNLLAKPHDEDGTCRQSDDGHQTEFPAGIHDDGSIFRADHAFQKGGNAEALYKGDRDSEISRVLRDLASAGLPFFLGHALDVGAHHLQKLQNDGRRNVRHDAESEHRNVSEAAAAENMSSRAKTEPCILAKK